MDSSELVNSVMICIYVSYIINEVTNLIFLICNYAHD